ncbi:hypothetical protein D3C72_1894540 [compost metagenome]
MVKQDTRVKVIVLIMTAALNDYGEALRIQGCDSRKSNSFLEVHVMDEIFHRVRWVDRLEVKSIDS